MLKTRQLLPTIELKSEWILKDGGEAFSRAEEGVHPDLTQPVAGERAGDSG